ncbi:MAG: hypothetical protein ACO3ZY_12000, partial [Phycisphaerales bacterium]
ITRDATLKKMDLKQWESANDYTGVTTVSAGKLAVSSFGDGVSAGALGLAGLAPANLVLATGTTLGGAKVAFTDG